MLLREKSECVSYCRCNCPLPPPTTHPSLTPHPLLLPRPFLTVPLYSLSPLFPLSSFPSPYLCILRYIRVIKGGSAYSLTLATQKGFSAGALGLSGVQVHYVHVYSVSYQVSLKLGDVTNQDSQNTMYPEIRTPCYVIRTLLSQGRPDWGSSTVECVYTYMYKLP